MSSEELKKLISEVRRCCDSTTDPAWHLADECERLAALAPCADDERERLVRENERLQPLQYAVGQCGASEVPESVFAAWKDSAGYRTTELYRQSERIAELEGDRDGERKAKELLSAGLESTCERYDALKHENRKLTASIRELEGAAEMMREACRSIVGMASLMRKPCDEDDLDSFARLQEEMVAAIAALPLPQPLAAQEAQLPPA